MGAHKGQNNFKGMQKGRVESSRRLIKHALMTIRKGVVFKGVNTLVVYVAERTGMHRTTIRRSSTYMRLILDYFGTQPGAAGFVSDEDASAAVMKARSLADGAKIKNLQVEVWRLKKTIERIQISQSPHNNSLPTASGNKQPLTDLSFANTAAVLLALLERLGEKELGIILDPEKNQILDVTEVGSKRIIAGSGRTKWFFEWLADHAYLGNPRTNDIAADHIDLESI